MYVQQMHHLFFYPYNLRPGTPSLSNQPATAAVCTRAIAVSVARSLSVESAHGYTLVSSLHESTRQNYSYCGRVDATHATVCLQQRNANKPGVIEARPSPRAATAILILSAEAQLSLNDRPQGTHEVGEMVSLRLSPLHAGRASPVSLPI